MGDFIAFGELDTKIGSLTLSLYHPSLFLKKNLPDAVRASYELKIGNFNQPKREEILISMMKINFLKRLESSIDSFRLTLERTIKKIDILESKIKAFEASRDLNPTYDFANLSETDFDDLDLDPEDLEIGGKHKINLDHLNLPDWLLAVRQDRAQLQNLYDHSKPVVPARDAKLARVREIITEKVNNPPQNKEGKPVRKVIVFTAFADTARYLYENLAPYCRETLGVHTALTTGDGNNRTSLGQTDYEHILTNFSPLSKNRVRQRQLPQDEEIEILMATDCISEGQNLQDADLLINYDIHWNPVRIMVKEEGKV